MTFDEDTWMLGECMQNIVWCYLVCLLERVDRPVVNELLVIRVLNEVVLVVCDVEW